VIVPNGNKLKDVVSEGVVWIHLEKEEDILSALINTVLKPQSSEKKRIFFLG
jgi:hypothetical protein